MGVGWRQTRHIIVWDYGIHFCLFFIFSVYPPSFPLFLPSLLSLLFINCLQNFRCWAKHQKEMKGKSRDLNQREIKKKTKNKKLHSPGPLKPKLLPWRISFLNVFIPTASFLFTWKELIYMVGCCNKKMQKYSALNRQQDSFFFS